MWLLAGARVVMAQTGRVLNLFFSFFSFEESLLLNLIRLLLDSTYVLLTLFLPLASGLQTNGACVEWPGLCLLDDLHLAARSRCSTL